MGQILSATVVRLYAAPPPGNGWIFTNVTGPAVLLHDPSPSHRGHFISVVNIKVL